MAQDCSKTLEVLNQTFLGLQEAYNDCGCGEDASRRRSLQHVHDACDLHVEKKIAGLKIGAIFIVLVASFVGISIPLVGRKFVNPYYLAVVKHFGTGVIISLALVHMLLPAVAALNGECQEFWHQEYEAWPYLLVVITIFFMHGVDFFIAGPHNHGLHALVDDHSTTTSPDATAAAAAATATVAGETITETKPSDTAIKMETPGGTTLPQIFLMEVSFVLHSVFIGLALGFTDEEFEALLVALVFHQMFEGVGLGAKLADPRVNFKWFMGFLFVFSAPLGISIGLWVSATMKPNAQQYGLAMGVIEAICCGILLYIGFLLMLIDLPDDVKMFCRGENVKFKKMGIFFAMWLGAGLMSFIGKYL